MLAPTSAKDLALAIGATVAGGGAILLAMREHWNPQDMNPGVVGCVTAGVVGFLLALLDGYRYRTVVALAAPIAVLQLVVVRAAEGPALGAVGIELVLLGFVGFVLLLRDPRAGSGLSG